MIDLDTSPCTCTQCAGSTCSCGCQDNAAREQQASGASCACPARCGCDASEQGCLCAVAS
jgi:hypothetical protein